MIVILGLLFLGAASAFPHFGGKIVGGSDARDGDYPYIVSLWRRGSFNCGGSILSSRFILTAAHCVAGGLDEPGQFEVEYGHVDLNIHENVIQVRKIHSHYNEDFDVALLELAEDIQFGKNAQPVKLPASTDKPGDDAPAVVVGWGLDKSGGEIQDILQIVDFVLFTDEFCKSTEPRYDPGYHVCAGVLKGGKGECNGDSGGPLTVNGVEYGVVSWSVKPCTNKDHPGIYVRVTAIRDWITEVTGI